MSPIIELRGVSFRYGRRLILEDIDLRVEAGEFLGLVGPNGGGKSTLLKIILGLLPPSRGRVEVLGRPPEEGRRELGYVPQFALFPRDFPITVLDAVLLGRLGKTRWIGPWRRSDREIAQRVLKECEIAHLAGRSLDTLSGGQMQRVLVARALASEPWILLLDEPTANVDLRGEKDIFDLFRALNERMTIVVVSHDIAFISEYVGRVACLNRTLVCHRAADISGDLVQELYGAPVRAIHHDHHGRGQS